MSSIKPPDGRIPGAASPTGGPAPATPGAEQRPGVSFDDALAAAERARVGAPPTAAAQVQQTAETSATQSAARASAADPVAELAQAVRSGAVSAEQALDRLVERVADGMGRSLSTAQRAELGSLLRAALQTDPALTALREALDG